MLGLLLSASAAVAAGPGQYSSPDWLPLRNPAKVGCVYSNCAGPYHGYWAVDFLDPEKTGGDPVYAAGAGQVSIVSSTSGGCGGPGTPSNVLKVDHGSGVATYYYHLASFTVANGAWVDAGTQIAVMGSTGYTDPCPTYHLHFEKRVNGTRVDPGPLKACHGSTVVTYPGALGYGSWNSIPPESQTVYSHGVSCGSSPPPPPPPPDEDQDGVPDSNDVCVSLAGLGALLGCPTDLGESQPPAAVDFNGDGKADYCRLVGGVNNQASYAQCTLGGSDSFGATVTSAVLDYGFDTGRAWTDFDGDGKADYCRRVGGANNVASYVQCTLSDGNAFGATITSPVVDFGFEFGRGWVDFNGDGKADYCRLVGGVNNQASYAQCTLSTGNAFGATVTSGVLDYGYTLGRAWTDFNGDGKADYCRRVGGANNQASYVQCTLSDGNAFGATVTSGVVDYGFDTGRAWVDFNGDGKADYCRLVGGVNNQASYAQCTLSTGTAFGATITSGVLDYGFDTGRGWPDFNGDGKADYCRRVGGANNQASYVQCTLNDGNAFGATVTSGVVDYGFDPGRAWVGSAHPPAPTLPPPTAAPGATGPVGGGSSSRRTRCVVPQLRRKGLAEARRALERAHCRLGRVRRLHHSRRGRHLRVVSQSSRPGARHAVRYKVNVTAR